VHGQGLNKFFFFFKYQAAVSGEGLLKLALTDHRRQIKFLTQEVEKLKLSHKNTVDRLQLELLEAKRVGSSVSQTRVHGSNDAAIVVMEEMKEPGTPFISEGFNSPAMASPEARSDQSRGSTHIHSLDERARYSTAMASPEVRSDQVHGAAQDRGVGSGMMLSPQRESSGQKADLTVLGAGVQGMQALAQSVISGKTVYLQGAKITRAQVANFVDRKRKQLRSGVFLIEQLDADIDENAMNIIDLKLVHSRAILQDQVHGVKSGTRRTS
jgi:hypothetical protein